MRVYFHLLAIFLLLNYSNSLAEATDITPKIPPGYQPIDVQTERGLWMELEEYETAIKQSALLVKDKQINDYVKSAACKVAGDYCNDLRVYIIRNPGFNASMTANGIMQVWTGLLVRVSDEHELAAVLGHELAHYTQLHTLERLRQINEKMASGSIIDFGILLATGVPVPVGQLSAIASLMAFSQDQEEEADLLGVKFMAQSGYNPNAAARVWEMIVEEEEEAVAKSREPDMFSKTHPSSTDRIVNLKSFVNETYPKIKGVKENINRHTNILEQYYMMLMEDQLDTNRFGRTQNILRTHMEIGVKPGLIYFFQGEMYRQRKGEGDLDLAKKSYKLAINSDEPIADAYRNLGYIELKQGNSSQAIEMFSHYLELKPDADDRAMIEFYLQE